MDSTELHSKKRKRKHGGFKVGAVSSGAAVDTATVPLPSKKSKSEKHSSKKAKKAAVVEPEESAEESVDEAAEEDIAEESADESADAEFNERLEKANEEDDEEDETEELKKPKEDDILSTSLKLPNTTDARPEKFSELNLSEKTLKVRYQSLNR